MAELIDLLFGLWCGVGCRKHKFNRIRQVAPMCPPVRQCALMGGHIGAAWQIRLNCLPAAAMRPDVKLL